MTLQLCDGLPDLAAFFWEMEIEHEKCLWTVIIYIYQLQKADLVTIRQKCLVSVWLFFQSFSSTRLLCFFHYGIRQVYLIVCVCVCSTPFSGYLGGEGPSAGFLLSLLRGPQRLLIIPDLLLSLTLPPSLGPCGSFRSPLSLCSPSQLCLPSCMFKITPLLGSSH